jgi:hypothetical protein
MGEDSDLPFTILMSSHIVLNAKSSHDFIGGQEKQKSMQRWHDHHVADRCAQRGTTQVGS